GPASTVDEASAIAVGRDGAAVFVTGQSGLSRDYRTIAYHAASGSEAWEAIYASPGGGTDTPTAIASSTDGSRVYVTGRSTVVGTGTDFVTLAYQAATGAQIWLARTSSPGRSPDAPVALAVSPTRPSVYVTGSGTFRGQGLDYLTVAYSTIDGS